MLQLVHAQNGAAGAARGVKPDGLAGGRERRVGQRQPERFADNLRGGSGAQKLAASAGRCAGAATHFGGVFERDLLLRKARADGLDFARVFPDLRQKRDAAGNQDGRLLARGSQRHHHGGQALVACGDADDALASGQRAHEAAKNDGGIVAIGQRVEHARGALRAAVAGIGAGSGKGDGAQCLQFARGLGHQQADLPVTGVEAKSDGLSVFGAQAAMRAQDEEFRIEKPIRLPAHAGVLRKAEEISGWLGEQHLRGEGQQPGRTLRMRGHA